jgi:hypothetical protein
VEARHEPAAHAVRRAWAVVVAEAEAEAEVEADGDKSMSQTKPMIAQRSHQSATTLLMVTCFVFASAVLLQAGPQSQPKAASSTQAATAQTSFASPQEAADALVKAAENHDKDSLKAIFGPDGDDLISTADPVADKNSAAKFVELAHEQLSISKDPKHPNTATVVVGKTEWPLPLPLVGKGGKWRFDAKAGRDEILRRRIGANELDAIQVCRGFVEAQHEYASEVHDNSGLHQYAQKIISTPGKQDGLYWQNADGTAGGPVSGAVAQAIEEGYSVDRRSAYHGYYFKVLTGQGPAAPMGKLNYVIDGYMIGGFALIAAPAEYRVTGVKTFIVGYDGIVYEKDLGADTLNIAKKMDLYNPDQTWTRTEDEWPEEDSGTN